MKKIIVMLLALAMVLGLGANAFALELEAKPGIIGGGSAEISPITPGAGGSVGPAAGIKDTNFKVIVDCECGTSTCSAYVEVWQGGALKETVTSGNTSTVSYYPSAASPVTLKAFDGSCGKGFTKWVGERVGKPVTIPNDAKKEITLTTISGFTGYGTITATFSSAPAVEKYAITFNANGGKTNGVSGLVNLTSSRFEKGTEVNLATAYRGCSQYKSDYIKSLSSDYSTNYRLVGWNTKADGTGTHYDMNETISMFSSDTTLYAEWESYEWIHWNVKLGEGGEAVTHHINGSINAYAGEFKMYCGNSGNSYGKVPKAYYTPVIAIAADDWAFDGWYDGETLVSADATLSSTEVDTLRKLTLAESGAVLEARFDHTACEEHLEYVKNIDQPTCTEVGHDLYKCGVCGDEYTVDIPALGHNLSGWIHNREQHWHKCFRCGELLDVDAHDLTEWTSVYGEKNKEERHCTVCSFSEIAETVKINANGSSKPASSEENPNTGAAVPSVLPALAVLAGAAIILGKKK